MICYRTLPKFYPCVLLPALRHSGTLSFLLSPLAFLHSLCTLRSLLDFHTIIQHGFWLCRTNTCCSIFQGAHRPSPLPRCTPSVDLLTISEHGHCVPDRQGRLSPAGQVPRDARDPAWPPAPKPEVPLHLILRVVVHPHGRLQPIAALSRSSDHFRNSISSLTSTRKLPTTSPTPNSRFTHSNQSPFSLDSSCCNAQAPGTCPTSGEVVL